MKKRIMICLFVLTVSLFAGSKGVQAEEMKDTTPPKGKIVISKEYYWDTFYEDAAYEFERFRDVTFKFTAEDEESGIDKIEYYKSLEVLTLEQAEKIAEDEWTAGTELEIKVADEEQFYLYVRFTDKAGNQSIINTDGIVMHIPDEVEEEEREMSPVTGQNVTSSYAFYMVLIGTVVLLCILQNRKKGSV